MNKRVTIHDIARIAGVSSATVSRVLSNSSYPVSEKLRERIQQLAEEHHYIPNMIGKQLKTDRNMTIGVIIPTISNPFYASVMLGVEEIARRRGYHVLLCNSLQDGKLEEDYLQTLFEKQVKGVILSSISGNSKLISRLMKLGLQLVVIEQQLDVPDVLQIEFDYSRGGYMAASHLIEQGHRRIGYVTAPLDRPSRRLILQGFQEALRAHGLSLEDGCYQVSESESPIYTGTFEFENGKRLTRKLLELQEHPTAIFACNDLTAFGVLHELAEHQVKVPDAISVMGFDNIEFSQMVTPPLTTIKQPDYEMGKMACSMLLDKLSDVTVDSLQVMLQPKLVVRESVGKRSSG
ncbi:LacI family DNA-binding transcriptional regulator [Paenibacillus koleovorans]|uniref:LacI family DNA-binding transcriptional regulator n=1 Tax=Paenibacillus koleovorans TaxID=121608 RepID=UPI000FDCC964|nr:LacI family DNA-binding transcriptional regulator [Paenibacillus koleovorans]